MGVHDPIGVLSQPKTLRPGDPVWISQQYSQPGGAPASSSQWFWGTVFYVSSAGTRNHQLPTKMGLQWKQGHIFPVG